MSGLEVQEVTEQGTTLVTLAGDIDSRTAPEAQRRVSQAMHPGVRLALDLTEVHYMSSAGLRTMLLVYRQAQSLDGSVALVGVSPDLRSLMAATGFLEFFTLCDSVDEARSVLVEAAR